MSIDHIPQQRANGNPRFIGATSLPPASTASASSTQLRNYRRLTREVITAMRRLDFGQPEERLICLILEFSYLLGRDVAVFHEQNHLARLRNMSKSRISRTLDSLVASRVVSRHGAQLCFLPPANWRRPERNQRNPAEQLSLEDWLRNSSAQGFLTLFDLDHAVLEAWLETGAETSVVAPSATAASKPQPQPRIPVAPSATQSPTYIHDRTVHDPNIMTHASAGFLEREFEVGALGKKSAREILERLCSVCPIEERFKRDWTRRIEENARLVWFVATEAEQRSDIQNKAGWMNKAYLLEMGIE